MNPFLSLLALHVLLVLAFVAVFVLPTRYRMEKRARSLLRAYPGAERRRAYLSFPRVAAKRAMMEARIAEIEEAGWRFLQATEASPWRTLRTWGGGLHLHFIRPTGSPPDRKMGQEPRYARVPGALTVPRDFREAACEPDDLPNPHEFSTFVSFKRRDGFGSRSGP